MNVFQFVILLFFYARSIHCFLVCYFLITIGRPLLMIKLVQPARYVHGAFGGAYIIDHLWNNCYHWAISFYFPDNLLASFLREISLTRNLIPFLPRPWNRSCFRNLVLFITIIFHFKHLKIYFFRWCDIDENETRLRFQSSQPKPPTQNLRKKLLWHEGQVQKWFLEVNCNLSNGRRLQFTCEDLFCTWISFEG